MQSPGVLGYPPISDNFGIGKLPPVRKTMERRLCVGRIWIFLVLGVLLIVLGLVSVGLYFNIDGLTSSRKYTEILPMYINSASIILAGLSVCLLFWRRLKVLVFLCVVICVANGFLCGLTAVLTTTHVLKPLQYFTLCRHYMSQQLCQCFSPYRRDTLSLEYSETEETKYDFEDASSCSAIENTLPDLLYTLVAIYAVVFLISLGSAVVALLVLRTERIKRGFYRDGAYEEVYTVSGSSSQDQSDSEPEVIPEITTNPIGEHLSIAKNSLSRNSNLNSLSRNSNNQLDTPSVAGTLRGRSITPQNTISKGNPIHETPAISRARTLDDFGKESLATRYRITKTPDHDLEPNTRQRRSKTPDRDLQFNVRHRLSKTPDRDINIRRRESFSGSKRLSRSCDSLDSSGSAEKLHGFNTNPIDGRKKGKLKEHRRKGKRAATVHNLDTDQLLLILNLQMRYLQETKDQQLQNQRRAVTPQPTSQRPVIPQKVRSHTPQPYRAKTQNTNTTTTTPAPGPPQPSANTWAAYSNGAPVGRTSNIRTGSDSSSRSGERIIEGLADVTNDSTNDSDSFSGSVDRNPSSVVPIKNSGKNTAPIIRNGHNPYLQGGQRHSNSVDQMHYVTYSDSMLSGQQSKQPKPKSRASVQNHFLPPEPLHRGSHQQLPPQPLSRHRSVEPALPPQPLHRGGSPLQPLHRGGSPLQPLHRGGSAFHIVDRSSQSRSPSVASDRVADLNELKSAKSGKKTNKDYADEAIRQNFQLNSRQFILTGTMENGNQFRQLQTGRQPSARSETGEAGSQQTFPADDLPPYSGPPSYREYVSSCDNSVNSSLSSNPEEIYSFPKRRIRKDQKVMGYKESGSESLNLNSKPDSRDRNYNIREYENENIYGNGPGTTARSRKDRNMQHSGVQRVRGQSAEAIYSSPSRSRVKQCIVPEDYYAALHKSVRPGEAGGRRFSQDKNHSIGSCGSLGNSQSEYTNVNDIECGGMYGFSPRNRRQIAPDEKYHEYEDVYDTVEPVSRLDTLAGVLPGTYNTLAGVDTHPYNTLAGADPHTYSVNTHGFMTTIPSSKSKPRSPRKQKAPYPVSNVTARIPNFNGAERGVVSAQVTQSVQNVHAENVANIPRIKLTDVDTDDGVDDDDDVFVDGNAGSETSAPSSNHSNHGVNSYKNSNNINTQGIKCSNMKVNNVHKENMDRLATEGADHNISDDIETDTGYMKMSLPQKQDPVYPVLSTTANEISGRSHMTDDLTNEISGRSHMTDDLTNEISGRSHMTDDVTNEISGISHMADEVTNEEEEADHMTRAGFRPVPDGVDTEEEPARDQANYEETGV